MIISVNIPFAEMIIEQILLPDFVCKIAPMIISVNHTSRFQTSNAAATLDSAKAPQFKFPSPRMRLADSISRIEIVIKNARIEIAIKNRAALASG